METPEFDDVGDAIHEGRALRPANSYRILFALENVDFRPLAVPVSGDRAKCPLTT